MECGIPLDPGQARPAHEEGAVPQGNRPVWTSAGVARLRYLGKEKL